MVTGSTEVLVTSTWKVNSPPGSGRKASSAGSVVTAELAVLATSMVGSASVRLTLAPSLSVAVLGSPPPGGTSSSTAVAVTVSSSKSPASPTRMPPASVRKRALNVQS